MIMRTFLASCVLLLGATNAALAVDARDPASVVGALQDLGYRAQLTTDNAGDPKILSTIDATSYEIYFYSCTENQDCRSLLFSAGFDLEDGVTYSLINEWNRLNLVGKAFVDDENDPFLEHFVTTEGGLSETNFEDVIAWWRVAIRDFKQEIDW